MISVVIIGSGNVAKHLIHAFSKIDNINLKQVYARKLGDESLMKSNIPITNDLSLLVDADITIIAVSDDAIADISCDIDGPVASTIRSSTIADPFYGYDPQTQSETTFDDKNAITVMAVDNLPCELPKDASEDFGNEMLSKIIPSLLISDDEQIIANATICKAGDLTPNFEYLRNYVNGN